MAETIPGPAGPLEALFRRADREPAPGVVRAAVVCHPHPAQGGTLHNKVVYAAARGLLGAGVAVLRFNFRGVGLSAGKYDEGRGERDDIRAALDWLAAQFPGEPLLLAGFSFGAWHGIAVAEHDPRVACVIGIGLPVASYGPLEGTGGGRPGLFVSGSNDAFGPPDALRAALRSWAGPVEVVIAEGADHFFDLTTTFSTTGVRGPHRRAELESTIAAWVQRSPARGEAPVG